MYKKRLEITKHLSIPFGLPRNPLNNGQKPSCGIFEITELLQSSNKKYTNNYITIILHRNV